ncbi:MAG: RNB domain-containing ribonuclease [Deltaproteobacteria bacterium]|nr:RNB domain-containing ribonuclease [Deltaproteobacteria bacterium]
MIVEFLEGGEFVLGFVTNPQAARGRQEVTLADGRSLAISPARVLVSSDCAEPSDKVNLRALLGETEDRRDRLSREVSVEELWGVLEGEGPEFSYEDLAGLNFGRKIGPDEKSAVLRAIQEDSIFFEFAPEKARRRSGDEIEKLKAIREREEAKKRFLAEGAAWIAGWLANEPTDEPENAQVFVSQLMEFVLEGKNAANKLQIRELLASASLPADPSGAFEALAAVGHLRRHENLTLLRLGLKKEIDPDVLKEAEEIVLKNDFSSSGRLDLTGLPTATVDSPGAHEYDDALSLETLADGSTKLYLHIADVAALVAPDSLTDKWASFQSSSIYLPEATYPMLPVALTESVCSLKSGSVRPAFSLIAVLDSQGQVQDFAFRPSLIEVDQQLSFTEADGLLDRGQGGMLEQLEKLSLKLLDKRLGQGGQNIQLPHMHVKLKEDGSVHFRLDHLSRSSQMVGELMVLANHLAAKALMEAGFPCPFRYQNAPKEINWTLPEDSGPRLELAYNLASRRATGLNGLSLEPLLHHGLGVNPYTTFTSPMRRYTDLLVARQLRALSAGKEPVYNNQKMLILAAPAEETQRSVRRMQHDRQRYWLSHYLKPMVGQNFKGLVYNRIKRWFKICVTDFMLEADLNKLPNQVQPGDEVWLKLVQVNPRLDFADDEKTELWRFEFADLV